jgi:hypothetical protein
MKRTAPVIILCAMVFLSSCGDAMLRKLDDSNFTIVNDEDIAINKGALLSVLRDSGLPKGIPSAWKIELVVLRYSSGREVFTLSSGSVDTVSSRLERGGMTAMLKIFRGGRLRKVLFVESGGYSEQEIFSDMARGIGRQLGRM